MKGQASGSLTSTETKRSWPASPGNRRKRFLVAGIEPLHVADLTHLAGTVARGDEPVDVGHAVAERLLAKDVQAGGEGRQDMVEMKRIGRGHDDGVELVREQFRDGGHRRHGEGLADERPRCRRGIADRHEGEAVAQALQIGNVLDLGDHAGADHAGTQDSHGPPLRAWVAPWPYRHESIEQTFCKDLAVEISFRLGKLPGAREQYPVA